MTTYAKANRTAQWFSNKFSSASFRPNCGVLHTTEGYGWPGYSGGAMAPNYTVMPNFVTKRLDWRAHFEDEESSRALVNLAGGVDTNTANAIQVELVGTCDPKYATSWGTKKANVHYIYWPAAPEWALKSLAEFIVDMNKRHGIKIASPAVWTPYPQSYGPGGQRFTFAQWKAFYGWCGHQHVPENTHGDPGALPWKTIENLAKSMLSPVVTPPTPSKPVPSKDTEMALSADDKRWIEERLDAHDAYVLANLKATIGRDVTATGTKIDKILNSGQSAPDTPSAGA